VAYFEHGNIAGLGYAVDNKHTLTVGAFVLYVLGA